MMLLNLVCALFGLLFYILFCIWNGWPVNVLDLIVFHGLFFLSLTGYQQVEALLIKAFSEKDL